MSEHKHCKHEDTEIANGTNPMTNRTVMFAVDEDILTPEKERELRESAYVTLSIMKMCRVLPDRKLAKLIKDFPTCSYTKNRPYP